jgi:hypothetical protein
MISSAHEIYSMSVRLNNSNIKIKALTVAGGGSFSQEAGAIKNKSSGFSQSKLGIAPT